MKLVITQVNEPIDVFGLGDPLMIWQPCRKVFIDGKPVPPNLTKIILLGFDVAQEQYLDLIDKLRKEGTL